MLCVYICEAIHEGLGLPLRPLTHGDRGLYRVLRQGEKMAQPKARYSENAGKVGRRCGDCKFFIELDEKCFITDGKIVADGVCKYFTSWEKDREPLPGDLVWEHVKKTGEKLTWKEGYVLLKGDEGYQCRDCKFYLYLGGCLIIKGKFKADMSCRYIVKPGEGVRLEETV